MNLWLLCIPILSGRWNHQQWYRLNNLRMLQDTNFWGSAYTTRFAIPYLRDSGGKIIVLSSSASWLPAPRLSIYNVYDSMILFFATHIIPWILIWCTGKFRLLDDEHSGKQSGTVNIFRDIEGWIGLRRPCTNCDTWIHRVWNDSRQSPDFWRQNGRGSRHERCKLITICYISQPKITEANLSLLICINMVNFAE